MCSIEINPDLGYLLYNFWTTGKNEGSDHYLHNGK